MPVGFVSIGWGATHIALWLPGAEGSTAFNTFQPNDLFGRFEKALKTLGPSGARAILWHQGESDTMLRTTRESYVRSLKTIIAKTRDVAGYQIGWYVSVTSFASTKVQTDTCPTNESLCLLNLYKTALAQDDVIKSGIPGVFKGATTDVLKDRRYRYDDLHFNQLGLIEHAKQWFDAIKTNLPK
jgi:hypothetical protein